MHKHMQIDVTNYLFLFYASNIQICEYNKVGNTKWWNFYIRLLKLVLLAKCTPNSFSSYSHASCTITAFVDVMFNK